MCRSVFFLVLVLFSTCLFSQGILKTQNKDIVDENGNVVILRGMGLGGWMVQEGYMLQTADFAGPQHKIKEKIQEVIGDEATEDFYEAWLSNHVRKIDIDSLKSWGFNSVRLPMHYNLFTLPIEDEPVSGENTWLEKGFTLTDSLISWCKQNDMWVVLDLHAAPGGQGYDAAISDYDDSKPSLWESSANQAKTVALWQQLAERYKDETTVAGYDLLNEVNWDLPGGSLLRSLYGQITDAIRSVDTEHIIFIEGNWFANDFTGLTPPWDDNMVYSPHKYWSTNDQASIQWVLNLRDQYDIPLYLGESGENSNVWFNDAISLLEGEGIGWAWWPMKKIEAIAGPLSVNKNFGYEALLNYWKGNGTQPNQQTAINALMGITENLKLENCEFEKGVVDAMFRQVNSDETIPYKQHTIPGVIFAPNYDLGKNGFAYYDKEVATYHVSTGNFTAWNNGWTYRNDGVDMEPSMDNINTNGVNIGWVEAGEWLKYTTDIQESGLYDIKVRVATGAFGGKMHFSSGGADITESQFVFSTGGGQDWETQTIFDVILSEDQSDIVFHFDGSGFNLGSFEFVKKGEASEISTKFISGITKDETHVKVYLNKPLDILSEVKKEDFAMLVDGSSVNVLDAFIDPFDTRIIHLEIDTEMVFTDVVKASYFGITINAEDGSSLDGFAQKELTNNLPTFYIIPGRIQAEDYIFQQGIELENANDTGGGQNIGYLDVGDYAEYDVYVQNNGIYSISYRNASDGHSGGLKMQLIDQEGNTQDIHSVEFESTGGWQSWQTTSFEAFVPEGRYTLRLTITKNQFNLNWFDFNIISSNHALEQSIQLTILPNPSNGNFNIEADLPSSQDVELKVLDVQGRLIYREEFYSSEKLDKNLFIPSVSSGTYLLRLTLADGSEIIQKLVIGL